MITIEIATIKIFYKMTYILVVDCNIVKNAALCSTYLPQRW